MGRRKIEIKAIKDDRNRSVTFLKRKGGLFKKAYELSVLCSVEVAIVIFGQNKKLYEFSSGNIHETLQKHHIYGAPHEHKGPNDFAGRGGGDYDDDDDEVVGTPSAGHTPPRHDTPHLLPNQPGLQHIRTKTLSASPPTNNALQLPGNLTPPQLHNSRPNSKNQVRASSNLVPANHPHPQAAQQLVQPTPQAYSQYPTNALYYQSQTMMQGNMQMHPQPPAQMGQHPYVPSREQQLQQAYLQEHRRQSMPANIPSLQTQPQHRDVKPVIRSPPRTFQSPPLPEAARVLPMNASKSSSIYTPVDDNRSVLAQHWGAVDTTARQIRADAAPRSQSIDMGATIRERGSRAASGMLHPSAREQHNLPPRPQTAGFAAPSRVGPAEAKRPRLTVQIPSEQSDGGAGTGSGTNDSSPRGDPTGSNPHGTPSRPPPPDVAQTQNSAGVVLPPPSPSASAVLSAGASGPKNPFARPAPPNTGGNVSVGTGSGSTAATTYREETTPMSALPSRFMLDSLLPSPSSFYPAWDFGGHAVGGGGGTALAGGGTAGALSSPQVYQPMPVATMGPGFTSNTAAAAAPGLTAHVRDDEGVRKRKSPAPPDGGSGAPTLKKLKP